MDPDAAVDATPDSPTECPASRIVTGEYLDVEATDEAYTAIYNASWQLVPNGATDTTSPNGRVELCAPNDEASVRVAVVGPSPYLPADVYLERWQDEAAIAPFSVRGLSAAQASALLQAHAKTPDADTGSVFVLQTGTPQALQIDDANAVALSHDGEAWSPGSSGAAVLFLRVAPGARHISATGASLQGATELTVMAARHAIVRLRAAP